jgi:hypothetical protein
MQPIPKSITAPPTCVVCVGSHALEAIHQHLLQSSQRLTQALTAGSNTNLSQGQSTQINHATAQHGTASITADQSKMETTADQSKMTKTC